MIKFFVDDCEFDGPFNAVVLNGGVIVKSEQELEMIQVIEEYKHSIVGKRFVPIKYNLRDLKKYYEANGILNIYNLLLSDYDNFRRGLISTLEPFDYKVLISCIRAFNTERLFIKKTKEKVRRFSFVMVLMRFALEAEERNEAGQVIFDFPTGAEPKDINNEYACAYRARRSMDKVVYRSKDLRTLLFPDSISYSCTNYCALLQLSDIFLGAVKQFIECIEGKEGKTFGYDLIRENLIKFRGYPNRINRYGLVFDSGEGTRELKILVGERIKELSSGNVSLPGYEIL